MLFNNRFQGSTALIAGALVLSPVAALASDDDDASPHVLIGQVDGGTTLGIGFEGIEPDPTTGALIIPIDVFGDPFPFPLPAITGFSSTPFTPERDLAFEAPDAAEAAELAEFGLVPAPAGAELVLEAVALDDDFSLFLDDGGSGILLDTVGGTMALGSPEFDIHPFYLLETTDMTLGQTTTGTFRVLDNSAGGLGPSGTFDITLEVVPEPSTAALAMAGGAMLLRRRRG